MLVHPLYTNTAETGAAHSATLRLCFLHILAMDHALSVKDTSAVSPRATKIVVVGSVLFALGATSVALRIWARRIKGCSLRWNDYAMLLALVSPNRRIVREPQY